MIMSRGTVRNINVRITVNNFKCAGCFACYNACPYNAIEMLLSEEGFYIPIIDDEKCRNCNVCKEVCPIISPPSLERYLKPTTYACWSKDKEVRIASSSGGVFSELAQAVLKMGGTVYGVVWDINELKPVHVGASTIDMLKEMRGSKYVQSYIGKSYKQVVEYLKQGTPVMFSGTPCQVSALYNIVPPKFRHRLYTVNVVCHGVASIKFFKMYLKYVAKNKKVISINMRDKSHGWTKSGVKIKFDNGTAYISSHREDIFFFGYLNNLVLNNICYECPFSRIPAVGDITLGDFWGVPKGLYDESGVSIMLINSEKGKELVELVKDRLTLVSVSLEDIVKTNPRIIIGSIGKPIEREHTMKLISENRSRDLFKLLKWLKFRNDLLSIIIGYPSIVLRRLQKILRP